MPLSLDDKINGRTIKAAIAAFGQLNAPVEKEDRMASALDAVRSAKVASQFKEASTSGMLFALNKKPH